MKYKDCIDCCISQSLAEGREDHAELFRSYPQPNAEDWKRCLAEVKASGDDPSDVFRCIGRYELLLASRGGKTVLSAVAGDFVRCVRRIGIDGNRLPDLLTLHTLLNDAHDAGTRVTVSPAATSYDGEPNLDIDPMVRRLLPGLVEQQLKYWSMRQKGHSHKEAILLIAKEFSDDGHLSMEVLKDARRAEWAFAMAARLRDSVS